MNSMIRPERTNWSRGRRWRWIWRSESLRDETQLHGYREQAENCGAVIMTIQQWSMQNLERLVRVYAARSMRYPTCSMLDYFSYQTKLQVIVRDIEAPYRTHKRAVSRLVQDILLLQRSTQFWRPASSAPIHGASTQRGWLEDDEEARCPVAGATGWPIFYGCRRSRSWSIQWCLHD